MHSIHQHSKMLRIYVRSDAVTQVKYMTRSVTVAC